MVSGQEVRWTHNKGQEFWDSPHLQLCKLSNAGFLPSKQHFYKVACILVLQKTARAFPDMADMLVLDDSAASASDMVVYRVC